MDAARLRAAFPVLQHTAYLNAGTGGPIPEAARRAAIAAWQLGTEEGRGGRFHERVGKLADGLRERYASLLQAAPTDVALTTGTSDGCGRVVAGLSLGRGDEILTADDEHPGLQGPLVAARQQRDVTIRAVPLEELPGAIGPQTRLVACSHVSWHSGAIVDVAALTAAAGDLPVLLDGAQGVGAIGLDVRSLGVSFYTGSGQKWLCGPVGCGMLWVDPRWQERLAATVPGHVNLADPAAGLASPLWPDARRFDAGSLDISTFAAATAAFDVLAEDGWAAVHDRAARLAAELAEALRGDGHAVVARGPSTLVSWAAGDDAAAEARRDALAQRGIVIRALPGTGRLRASVGAWNDEDDLRRLRDALRA